VLALEVKGDARAYPLQILMWHEIVNDAVGGIPVTITYCPLCNSGIVFQRGVDGATLDFGTSGKLYKSDLVMYDRQSHWKKSRCWSVIVHPIPTAVSSRTGRSSS
jgi:hypothetical protein